MAPKGARRLRNIVKSAVASAIAKAHDHGLARLPRGGYRPLIVGYHRIVEDYQAQARVEMPSMLTSLAMFERHLECIGRSFQFASLDEIGNQLASGRPFDRPVAAITFDDGYEDVYELALPMLERKGIPAATFVVTDLVGRPAWQIHDHLYHLVAKAFASWDDPRQQMFGLLTDLGLPARGFARRASVSDPMNTVATLLPGLPQADVRRLMAGLESSVGNGFHDMPRTVTWEQVHDMRRRGFTIGSHTRSHVSLPTESSTTITSELIESKRKLESHLGERIDHFAYPGGHFTGAVVEAVVRAGYRFAYTACPHDVPEHRLLTLERLLLWEGSSVNGDGDFIPGILTCQAHSLWPPARRCDRVHHA